MFDFAALGFELYLLHKNLRDIYEAKSSNYKFKLTISPWVLVVYMCILHDMCLNVHMTVQTCLNVHMFSSTTKCSPKSLMLSKTSFDNRIENC